MCSAPGAPGATRVRTCRRDSAPPVDANSWAVGMIHAMSSLPAVSRTAVGVARVRALETTRPEPLFRDPYAAAFVAAAGDGAASADRTHLTDEQRRWRAGIALHVTLRTRFFDDYLVEAVAGGCEQVVLLGAGLDTRAFRLDWPSQLRWFELDLPEVLAFKRAVLDDVGAVANCDRRTLSADLSGEWAEALRHAGFVPGDSTAWLAEGLLVYLDAQTAGHVLGTVTGLSVAGGRLSFERGDVAGRVATADRDT